MAYVAVKGGTEAIEESVKRLTFERIHPQELLEIKTIMATMRGMIDQVMSESSLYSEFLAALAIKQSEGNMEEAVFLLRAHRSTLPRTLLYKGCRDGHDGGGTSNIRKFQGYSRWSNFRCIL